jgi:hypothetical protein
MSFVAVLRYVRDGEKSRKPVIDDLFQCIGNRQRWIGAAMVDEHAGKPVGISPACCIVQSGDEAIRRGQPSVHESLVIGECDFRGVLVPRVEAINRVAKFRRSAVRRQMDDRSHVHRAHVLLGLRRGCRRVWLRQSENNATAGQRKHQHPQELRAFVIAPDAGDFIKSYDRMLVTSEVRRQFELVLLQLRFRR